MPSLPRSPEEFKEHSRIVVGVDGSDDSRRALAWAAREAEVRGADLDIVHSYMFRTVIEDKTPEPFCKDRAVLEEAMARAAELAPTVHAGGTLTEPPAREALVAASEGADLLVVGPRGLGGVGQLMMGSVSSYCVHHAHCPVVVVRSVPALAGTLPLAVSDG